MNDFKIMLRSGLTLGLCMVFLYVPWSLAGTVATSDYLTGTSYEPDWWPSNYWSGDFQKMRELGFNVVRMTEFAWASLEPQEGRFDFAWLDDAIRVAQTNGIKVILTTPTSAVPAWLYKLHPEVLGANEKGAFTYGGRKGASLHSPAFRAAAERIVAEMARHYSGNTNVIGWQIDNEPGFPFVNYDHDSLAAFRLWLKRLYGTIDKLNESWGGAFWSNRYNHWDEIQFPVNSAEGGWRAGSNLDFRRFFSDSYMDWLRFEVDVLRPALNGRFYFANWPDTLWSVNVFTAAKMFSFTAWDNYTAMPGLGDFHEQFYAGLNHDLSRCSQANQRFIVAEQLARAPSNADPRGVRLQTFMDLAHGAVGTLFYEWRPPIVGNEAGYPSVLNVDGSFGSAAAECRQINQALARLAPELKDARTKSDLALIFSYDNQWDQGFWAGNTFRNKTGYDGNCKLYYGGMKILHRNIDVLPPDASLKGYRLVVAPGLQMVSDAQASSLNDFVRKGGILVLNAKAGTRILDGRMRELIAPGVFSDSAGLHITSEGTFRGITNEYFVTLGGNSKRYRVSKTMEGLQLRDAEAIGTFRGQGMDGKPAVTLHAFGKGFVVYVAAEVQDEAFYDALFASLADRFRIPPLLSAAPEVEVVSRSKGNYSYYFLLNLGDRAQTVRAPENSLEMIGDQNVGPVISLQPFGVAVLKVKSSLLQ